jgi:glycosyltransferase involved in cell wall biosynthesis
MKKPNKSATVSASKTDRPLRVAIIAPPWLALPVKGYGGIELVLEALIDELRKQGVEVEVFTNGAHKMRGVKSHYLFKEELYTHIHEPYYETAAFVQAHMLYSLNKIRELGYFDVIHDHSTHIGPAFWAMATQFKDVPPVLHTFHGPSFVSTGDADPGAVYNRIDLEQFKDMGRMYMACISHAMTETAPKNVAPHMLKAVHNAVEIEHLPFKAEKKDYFITLARFSSYKGQHVAVKLAIKLKKRLRMAGTVAGISSNRRLLLELSNPMSSYRNNADFRYYSDKILQSVIRHPRITYAGNLSGKRKMKFLSEAKALLFPIDWEEPFGMAVIEALACGTPVIAMKRGAMPEIIEHGVNGFLAENEQEFEEYMQRIDEIDPAACRESVERKFSADRMAAEYVKRYKQVIAKAAKIKD